MIEVGGSYVVSAILVAFVLVVSLLLGYVVRGQSKRTRLIFKLAGTLLIAIAALEKIGWSVHPWSTGSPAQAWDDMLFRVFALIGLGLFLVSWTMAFHEAGSRGSVSRQIESHPAAHRTPTI